MHNKSNAESSALLSFCIKWSTVIKSHYDILSCGRSKQVGLYCIILCMWVRLIFSTTDRLYFGPIDQEVTEKTLIGQLKLELSGLDLFTWDKEKNLVSVSEVQSILIRYHRNNILHLLEIPSIIAKIILNKNSNNNSNNN